MPVISSGSRTGIGVIVTISPAIGYSAVVKRINMGAGTLAHIQLQGINNDGSWVTIEDFNLAISANLIVDYDDHKFVGGGAEEMDGTSLNLQSSNARPASLRLNANIGAGTITGTFVWKPELM